ncbi:kelch motif family isoform A [Micractinium conductrix]|uniref:Kelch motif family isoform A n=1 Tax=Micractinium conductrix TaxID=554055 RepID=A0A2P6UZD8_9CHLO|nr:kelch motif family isoform A [Micractinium conductrix]|eukprot:PSC67212.1 kelch motif family isoform A [Micractinium conductrix]
MRLVTGAILLGLAALAAGQVNDTGVQAAGALAGFFFPPGKGSWVSNIPTGVVAIYQALMKDGNVLVYSNRFMGLDEFGTTIVDPYKKKMRELYIPGKLNGKTVNCGIHACQNAFCSSQVVTADSDVLIFGGHNEFVKAMRRFSYEKNTITDIDKMPSGRWYPSSVTLPDGTVLTVGGTKLSGKAGWHCKPNEDNPTYIVYRPSKNNFAPGGDRKDMTRQLNRAFPAHTYPVVTVTPDGGLIMSAGKTLAKYAYNKDGASVRHLFDFADRPGPSWNYPQTGVGMPLPMVPPHKQLFLLATGGSVEDRAKDETPARDEAHVIEISGGRAAKWKQVGGMPYRRVMGDAVTLCDGKVIFFGGAEKGIAGWGQGPKNIRFRDGKGYNCKKKCPRTTGEHYEPIIYDPVTEKWSRRGTLALAMRPRLYHSTATLLPNCQVMVAGSDVTYDTTAELYSPPYLSQGKRPVIIGGVPEAVTRGQVLAVDYSTKGGVLGKVTRALLLRTGTCTHSSQFDASSMWLEVTNSFVRFDPANPGGVLSVKIPASPAVVPPGMYMLVLNTNRGLPTDGKIISIK